MVIQAGPLSPYHSYPSGASAVCLYYSGCLQRNSLQYICGKMVLWYYGIVVLWQLLFASVSLSAVRLRCLGAVVIVGVVCSAIAIDWLWQRLSVARWLQTGCGRGYLQRDGCRLVVVESLVVASIVATRLQGVYNQRRPYDDGRRSKGRRRQRTKGRRWRLIQLLPLIKSVYIKEIRSIQLSVYNGDSLNTQ